MSPRNTGDLGGGGFHLGGDLPCLVNLNSLWLLFFFFKQMQDMEKEVRKLREELKKNYMGQNIISKTLREKNKVRASRKLDCVHDHGR